MPSFKLPLAAAFLGAAAFAMPAAAQQMVHHQETVVTTHTETHPDHPSGHHEMHKVCKNYWSNHHRYQHCRTVRWNH